MKKYIFHLIKFDKKKRIEIMGDYSNEVYQKVEKLYPDWQISMFWPEWLENTDSPWG